MIFLARSLKALIYNTNIRFDHTNLTINDVLVLQMSVFMCWDVTNLVALLDLPQDIIQNSIDGSACQFPH